jgi:hypothetical protein
VQVPHDQGPTLDLRTLAGWVGGAGAGSGAVDSVNGMTGAVTLAAADIGAQLADADLTAIATLAPADGSLLGRQAGTWTGRTPTQAKTDLSLDQVNNTTDLNKPVSTATSTALAGKAATAHTHATADVTSGTLATARLGSGAADTTTFLRGDSTWAVPVGGGGTVNLADTPDLTRVVAYTSTGQARPQWRGPVIWQGDITGLGIPTNAIPGKDWTQDFGARTDGARYFDGVSPDYAFAADSTSLRSPASAVTLAGFWRPSTYTATDGGLWGKTGNLAGRSMSYAVIRRDTTDARNLRFRLGLTTAGNVLLDPANMATTLAMDTWYFLACTWSSGSAPRMRVWTVSGTSLIDVTGGTGYTDTILYGADPFRVGKNDQTDTTGMHRVSLAAIGVHNAVVSDVNLASWRTNRFPPITLSGGFWALNGSGTTSEPDTAQTNTLTLSGIVHTTGGP